MPQLRCCWSVVYNLVIKLDLIGSLFIIIALFTSPLRSLTQVSRLSAIAMLTFICVEASSLVRSMFLASLKALIKANSFLSATCQPEELNIASNASASEIAFVVSASKLSLLTVYCVSTCNLLNVTL